MGSKSWIYLQRSNVALYPDIFVFGVFGQVCIAFGFFYGGVVRHFAFGALLYIRLYVHE